MSVLYVMSEAGGIGKTMICASLANNLKQDGHEVFVSKLSDRVKKKVNPNIFVGFIDFEIHKYRRPRG